MSILSKKIKISPNKFCPCGSNQKYKKCCYGTIDWPTILTDKSDETPYLSARGRNLKFKESLFALLQQDSEKFTDVKSIKKAITPDFVRALYESITKIWPPSTNLEHVYSRNNTRVAGLFIGDYELGYLEQAVIRHSLYADKILLQDPFLNPHVISPKYNPLNYPEHHLYQTLRNINRFLLLLPWVEEGIVDFIHTPAELNRKFGFETRSRALQENIDPKSNIELMKSLEEAKLRHKNSGGDIRTLLQHPDNLIRKILKERFPDMTNEQMQENLEEVYQLREDDPNFLDTLDKMPEGQYTIWSTGGTIENAHLTASMAKAYIFTDIGFRWQRLQQERSKFNAETSYWSPFSKAVQNAPFSFLNNVNLKVALKLRKEGRLGGVRRVMNEAYRTERDTDHFSESHAIHLAEKLDYEIDNAKAEWKRILEEIKKFSIRLIRTNMFAAGPLIANGHGYWFAGAGLVTGVGSALYGRQAYDRYRTKFPASFFIKLQE